MIAIIDYGMGNLRSVSKAFEKVGSDCVVTNDSSLISQADKIVVPGVGHFGDAMRNLTARGLDVSIKDAIKDKKPYLGLCLGFQILFEKSEEEPDVSGLGIFKGESRLFEPKHNGQTLKVPHMGWNTVFVKTPGNNLMKNVPDESYFYFVHSYFVNAQDRSIVQGTTSYGKDFDVMIQKENVYGLQFHPEKSQELGLKIIRNFSLL